jgi:hypothetical protein
MLYRFAPVIQVAMCHQVYQLTPVASIEVRLRLKAILYQHKIEPIVIKH